jgi:predicted kinase
VHINPDHFLETPDGRVTTPDRNAAAWRQSFAALDDALRARTSRSVVYVMIGCQASGKSTWARRKCAEDSAAIAFDAILVTQAERLPILQAAVLHQVPAVAVWFQTPLQACLERNAARPADEVVNEQGLRNVFAALERPEPSEGFAQIIEVRSGDA